MSTNWTAFPYKRALATAVAARAGITGLTPTPRVLTYWPSKDEPLTDSIIIATASDSADHVRTTVGGNRFEEQVELEGQIRVVRPGAGSAPANNAEDRAEAILAELDGEVRTKNPDVGDQSWNGKVINRASDLFAWTSGDGAPVMVCLIDFTVQYKAKTS